MIKLIFLIFVITGVGFLFSFVDFSIFFSWLGGFTTNVFPPLDIFIELIGKIADVIVNDYYTSLTFGVVIISVFFGFVLHKIIGGGE